MKGNIVKLKIIRSNNRFKHFYAKKTISDNNMIIKHI